MTPVHPTMLFILPADPSGAASQPSHHPLMTATLAGVALYAGANVKIIDALLDDLSLAQMTAKAKAIAADWIGIISYEYRRELPSEVSLDVATALRNELPSTAIGVLNCPREERELERAIGKSLDFICIGDSETAVHQYASNRTLDGPGMVTSSEGILSKTDSLKQTDWSILKVPAWELFEHHRYQPSAHRYSEAPVLPIMASRSCPFKCDFCPHSLYNTSDLHSCRPANEICAEIDELQKKYGVKHLEFYDPTFGINREHTSALCTAMSQMPSSPKWSCYSRADLLDDGLLRSMKEAGCHTILFGVESGNESVLERTNKGLSLAEPIRLVSTCRALGINTIASFILGLPLETKSSLRETLDYAQRLNPTFAQFHLAKAFFDHQEWAELGNIEGSWMQSGAGINGLPYTPNGLARSTLYKAMLQAYLGFYVRPGKLTEILRTMKSKQDLMRNARGVWQIVRHLGEIRGTT